MEWVVVLLLAVTIALFIWVLARRRTVEDGYAVPVGRRGEHGRLVRARSYVLRPGEEAGAPIYTGERAVQKGVPDIRLPGGLVVTVQLNYTRHYRPEDMDPAMLYSEPEREARELEILQRSVQKVVASGLDVIPGEGAPRGPLASLFRPFLGKSLGAFHQELQAAAREPLMQCGIVVARNTLAVDSLLLPSYFLQACQELMDEEFAPRACQQFVAQIAKATPGMTEVSLAQLADVVRNRAGAMRLILAQGRVVPEHYLSDQDTIVGAPVSAEASPPVQRAASRPAARAPTGSSEPPLNLPLTAQEMALLKELAT